MKTYAIVENGQVTNLILWDGASPWEGSEKAVLVPDDAAGVSAGFTYMDGVFAPPATPEVPDTAADDARARRDALLQASDWTQLADIPKKTRDAWAAYRQELRNVPQQGTFPAEVVWPDLPK